MGFIKRTHCIVPICPRCGSEKTGRYILYNNPNISIVEKYLRKGERIRPVADIILPYHNCYCEECRNEWHGDIIKVRCDNEEWEKYYKNKGLEREYMKLQWDKIHPSDERKQMLAQIKKENRENTAKGILFFFTGIRLNKKHKK